MTTGELAAYAEEMEPLRAEAMLDAAQVAAYPATMQFAPDAATSWWESLARTAAGGVADVVSAVKQGAGFMLNGASLGFDELRSRLSDALGGGVSG